MDFEIYVQRWKLMLYWQAMSYRTTALGIPFIWLRALQRAKSMFICLSPFWKSIMLVGMKQPCLAQATALIPVVSRWWWEPWVSLMAWYSLQVDFYKIHWAEPAKGSNTHGLGILGGRQMLVKLIQGSKVTSFLCQMDILTISPSSHVLSGEVAIHDKNSLVLPVKSAGRLTPGWGQVGQKNARSPGPAFPQLCTRPNLIFFFRCLHCLESLISSRYQFWVKRCLINVSVKRFHSQVEYEGTKNLLHSKDN